MNEHDHFSSVLDVEAVEESLEHHFGDNEGGIAADADEAQAHEQQAPRKRPIPKALLLIGGMVGFVVVGAGYQHFFGAHPQSAPPVAMMGSSGLEGGDTPLPAGTAITQQAQNGMLAHGTVAPPLPNPMPGQVSEPIGPIPSQQSSRATWADAAMAASAGSLGGEAQRNSAMSAVVMASGSTAAAPQAAASMEPSPSPAAAFSHTNASSAATMIPTSAEGGTASGGLATGAAAPAAPDASTSMNAVSAPDPKDVEIAKLQAEVDALKSRDRSSNSTSATGHAAAHRTAKHASRDARPAKTHPHGTDSATHAVRSAQHRKRTGTEVLAGYAIKQVIPGQGWVQDEQSGKQQVVAVGDFIGTAKVVRIDPDQYRIVTTAGVIQ